MSPHVAGFVAQILVGDNQHVTPGNCWSGSTRAISTPRSTTPKAVADERQAALAGLEAKYALQQATIRQAEADLAAKTAHAGVAGEDAVRYRKLALTGYGSRQNAERTSAADERARSRRAGRRRPGSPPRGSS